MATYNMEEHWETVHTIDEYYDRPRAGAAEVNGEPYWYRSIYLDGEWDSMENRFELTPISREFLDWELERNAIFKRWDEARKNGSIIWDNGDQNSFGALPNEMDKYRELNLKIDAFIAKSRSTKLARGHFAPGSGLVRWEILDRD